MGQGATGEPNCWGEGGRRGEHKKKPIVAQGATGEHKEKPGWGIRKSHVSIRKSPVRIRAETVSIRKSREHKGRDPQHKKNTMPKKIIDRMIRSFPKPLGEQGSLEPESLKPLI